jgi:hypothetical protein
MGIPAIITFINMIFLDLSRSNFFFSWSLWYWCFAIKNPPPPFGAKTNTPQKIGEKVLVDIVISFF